MACAQQADDWRDALRRWMTAEDMENTYSEEVMEQLEERAQEPINLNQTTREELEQLPFLTAAEVEGLIAYIDRYRPLRSLNELHMVTALDYDVRQLLTHFVCCGDMAPARTWPTLSDIVRDGRHTIMGTAKIPFYERRGDHNGYLGPKVRHDIRYQFNYKNRIKFGLTAAQDAGEPFFANRNKWGYDHYVVYLQLRAMGRLEELNLGTYRVKMGLGLIMNNGFYLGKLATLQSLGRSSHTLTAHSSRGATDYLQGAAATVRLGRQWKVTAFASWRAIDATLNADGTARTIVNDGYHRTPTEMARKHNTHRTDAGGTVGWRRGTLYVNVNGVFTHLDRRLQPDKDGTLYRRYAAEGHNFINFSADYGWNDHRWTLNGETAINGDGALATLHTVSCRLSNPLTVMAMHRYYDKRYTALHARTFSEGGSVQNEHGIYLGVIWRPTHLWTLQTYADYAHFSWPRYQVSAASDAFDALLSLRYSHSRWSVDGRYRLHIRQQDDTNRLLLVNRTEHRARLTLTVAATPRLTLRTQADGVVAFNKSGRHRGIMASQHADWQWRWLRADAHVGWFRTDDYDARLYQYEPSVAYDFSFPMYYGHGMRGALLLRAALGSHLQLSARMGLTKYFDRSTVGTALQQVDRSSLADLLVQLRCQL